MEIAVLLTGIEDLTFDMLKNAALALIILYGLNEIISKIVTKIGLYTKKNEKIEMFNPEEIKNSIHVYMDERYNSMQEKFDNELKDIRANILESHTETLAQNQEIKAELYLITECNAVIMDGLVQLDCNGPVKKMKDRMDSFMKKRAHDMEDDDI